jgi:hypothetical protein
MKCGIRARSAHLRFVLHTSAFILFCLLCRADDSRHPAPLQAIAATDSTEVHPDSVFEVTLSLQNLTGALQTIKIPDCAWDRVWKSSNRHVTWDFWDCDDNDEISIDIPPHQTYLFPKPLKMFVDPSVRKSHMDFRMGFKTKAFGKTLWSSPISLDVTP